MQQCVAESLRLAPWQRTLVRKVINQYRRFVSVPPVSASDMNPMIGVRSLRWSPIISDYVIDVDRAVNQVVTTRPDRRELVEAWTRLVNHDSRIGPAEAMLFRLLAPVFRDRELDPSAYFRPRRRW